MFLHHLVHHVFFACSDLHAILLRVPKLRRFPSIGGLKHRCARNFPTFLNHHRLRVQRSPKNGSARIEIGRAAPNLPNPMSSWKLGSGDVLNFEIALRHMEIVVFGRDMGCCQLSGARREEKGKGRRLINGAFPKVRVYVVYPSKQFFLRGCYKGSETLMLTQGRLRVLIIRVSQTNQASRALLRNRFDRDDYEMRCRSSSLSKGSHSFLDSICAGLKETRGTQLSLHLINTTQKTLCYGGPIKQQQSSR